MKNDQFAVYRVDRHSEGRDLWHLSYQEAVSRKLAIRIEYYRQMDIRPLLAGESAIALWKRMKESCEVSDVLVLNQNGEIHCYYVNEDYPQLLSGFIRLNPSGTLVTLDTENYRISGKPGNWMATDDIIIDGKQFYLMEHQEYHRQVAYIILDSYGKMIMEECKNGFDEKTKQKLHELMKTPEQREQEYQKYKERLEHYQKFFENGTYERSWESGTEENYNMVDGQVNNLKNAEEKSVERKPAQKLYQSSKKKPTGIFKGKERKALEKQIQQTESELKEKLNKLPDILKDDGYPDVQAFMKTYRKAEAIITQYNQDLAEWEQTVKNGQKPAEKQHRPPERQSVRNRLRQLQEESKQSSQSKQRKKSQGRGSLKKPHWTTTKTPASAYCTASKKWPYQFAA